MATLSAIRAQLRALINEPDPNNSHFSDSDFNEYINEAQTFLAAYIEYPRTIVSTQVTAGTANYSLPSDSISIITVYFGDLAIANDIRVLRVLNEESLKTIYPSWLSTDSTSRGRPRFAFLKERTILTLIPTPDADNAVTGKKYHLNYIQTPAALSSDSDTPELPLPYHDLLQFYAAHLAYLNLQVQEMADKMMASFSEKIKALQAEVNKESKEALSWQWTYNEDVSGETFGGITF